MARSSGFKLCADTVLQRAEVAVPGLDRIRLRTTAPRVSGVVQQMTSDVRTLRGRDETTRPISRRLAPNQDRSVRSGNQVVETQV